jgi:uncharacterized membrane protein
MSVASVSLNVNMLEPIVTIACADPTTALLTVMVLVAVAVSFSTDTTAGLAPGVVEVVAYAWPGPIVRTVPVNDPRAQLATKAAEPVNSAARRERGFITGRLLSLRGCERQRALRRSAYSGPDAVANAA